MKLRGLIDLFNAKGPATIAEVGESATLAFEKLRWNQEKELKEKELALQREQMRWNRWGNPAFVAIVAGLIGYLGNLYSSHTTRQQEIERQKHTETLEQKNREATLRLEREKQEGTLIVEAIKTGGSGVDKEINTAANLIFLADAGLITSINPDKLERLRQIAGERLPSLPGPEGVEFQPSPDLTKELQGKLTKALTEYQAYLSGLGYTPRPGSKKIGVRIDKEIKTNAYFDNKDVVLGSALASDPEYALSEYTWQILRQSNSDAYARMSEEHPLHLEGFAYGLKNYFVCSYFDDSRVGKNYFELTGIHPSKGGQTSLFDLKNAVSFANDEETSEPHNLGEIWGAAFWEIREKAGRARADPLIFAAWRRLKLPPSKEINPEVFIKCVIDTSHESGDVIDAATIREIFKRHNLL
jgi:hypothetical protein